MGNMQMEPILNAVEMQSKRTFQYRLTAVPPYVGVLLSCTGILPPCFLQGYSQDQATMMQTMLLSYCAMSLVALAYSCQALRSQLAFAFWFFFSLVASFFPVSHKRQVFQRQKQMFLSFHLNGIEFIQIPHIYKHQRYRGKDSQG